MTDSDSSSNAGDASASPALRFVVLYHDGVADPHFDLMIESRPGGPLYTWRCAQNPLTQHVTSATRLSNHRPHYLSYEGSISGGRGQVRRVAAGHGRFRRVKRRAWLWEVGGGGETRCASYWVAPVVIRGRRQWLVERHEPANGVNASQPA